MENQFLRIKELVKHRDKLSPSVSKADIGWHLYHVLLTVKTISNQLEVSDPNNYKWKFNFIKEIIQLTGKIPRGRGNAPERVRPPSDYSEQDITSLLHEAQMSWAKMDDLEKNHFFAHPLFGNYNKKAALRFIAIHSNHHLGIADDILKSS